MYARAADISVNGNAGANVFVALTGKTVTMNRSALHRSEALQNLGATTSVVVTTTGTTTYIPTGFKRYVWSEAML